MTKSALYRICQYPKYFFLAKGEFSLHSPFVFAFFTNVIKRKKYKKGSQNQQLICNIKNYLPSYKILNLSVTDTYSHFNDFISTPCSVIVIDDFRLCRQNFLLWQKIINTDCRFISLDFFSFGILINNPDIRCKQNYILKKH